ncbi:MAG: HAD hydrolase-like protein [Candidatus Pacebacteria bacterium]|nr:HAD hydrolase-like protein [Candidatus Paceibacterota bacterium]
MVKKIKYIVTDLNGTLVDAMPTYTRVFCDVLKRRAGLESPEIAKYSIAATGKAWDEQFAAVLEMHEQPKGVVPELMGEFCELVNQEKYSLYPQVEELLQFFKAKNYKVFVTSGSGTGAMIKRIYELGIFPYVDFILGFDVYKKSPKHIEMLAEKEGMNVKDFAEQAVYFGDGPGDMQIADICNIYTIGVAQSVSPEILKEAGADLVIEKIGEAMDLKLDKLKK